VRALDFDRAALKELLELPAKQFRQVVVAILELLREPQPHFSKQLSGYPYLRLAVGEYRVIYRFDATSVKVLAFGKRNDGEVYRRLSQKNG
jgi:mRNA interferase RelE/StbE